MLIDIFFMLPLTWLVAGLPLPMYQTLNAQAIAAHTLISAGLGVVFVTNGLLIGSWLDRLLLRFGTLRKEANRIANKTANKPAHPTADDDLL